MECDPPTLACSPVSAATLPCYDLTSDAVFYNVRPYRCVIIAQCPRSTLRFTLCRTFYKF